VKLKAQDIADAWNRERQDEACAETKKETVSRMLAMADEEETQGIVIRHRPARRRDAEDSFEVYVQNRRFPDDETLACAINVQDSYVEKYAIGHGEEDKVAWDHLPPAICANLEFSDGEEEGTAATHAAAGTAPTKTRRQFVFAGYELKGDCTAKADSNPERLPGQETINHIEAAVYSCGVVVNVKEYLVGEGAMSNVAQLEDLLEVAATQDTRIPIVFHIDDACSTILHLNKELVAIARGQPIRHRNPWVIFALSALDIVVDAFHHRNHVERWCRKQLDPATRAMPEENNSAVVEQLWSWMQRFGPCLRSMKESNYRFMLLSLCALRNVEKARETEKYRDTRKFASARSTSKHHRRTKTDREPALRLVAQGRIGLPADYYQSRPQGYDPRLVEEVQGVHQRRFFSVPVAWFRDNYEELLTIVREILPQHGFGHPPPVQVFRARSKLQEWMVDSLVAERATKQAEDGVVG